MSLPFPPHIATAREPHIPLELPSSTDLKQTPLYSHSTENCFADGYGRTILLRGLNVGGCSKVPAKNPSGLDKVTYSGRPFKTIREAEIWWARLRLWGVGVVRWVMTWEAIEPNEIGKYNDEYITYVYQVLEKAGQNGLKVFLDVHQDCWSRLSGGSGAPAWTFSLVGLDPSKFHGTFTSALLPPDPQQKNLESAAPYVFTEPHLPPYKTSLSKPSSHLWPTNYSKLSTASMFTLFFAGETFASKAKFSLPGKGERNVGTILQDAYISAFTHVARRLAGLECVLGWDVMNEPHPGFIGLKNLRQWNEDTELHLGVMPNGVQGMVIASGGEGASNKDIKIRLPIYHRSWPRPSTVSGYVEYEISQGPRVWAEGRADIWKEEGVWWWDETSKNGYEFKPDYFTKHPQNGSTIDFERDFYEPFLRRFLVAVRGGRKQGLKDLGLPDAAGMAQWSFIEPVPNIGPPSWVEEETSKKDVSPSVCYAPHWYDLRVGFEKRLSYRLSFDVGALALGSRNFYQHSYFGRLGLLGNYTSQFNRLVSHLRTFRKSGKPTPVLVGETGVPFDINGFEGYKTGDIHGQMVMLDSVVGAMERVGKGNLNWTLWNFTSENYVTVDSTTGTLESGDGWNSEDFSLVSRDHALTEVNYPSLSQENSTLGYRITAIRPHNSGTPLTRAQSFGSLYTGARCIGAWIRPYPAKIAGILQKSYFVLANIDNGTRECWGGTFTMRYIASDENNSDRPDKELTRTTEVFIPAYHFGGQPWVLQVHASLKRSTRERSPIATILITSGEPSGHLEIPKVAGAKISWAYSEARQSLNIIHSQNLAGYTIEVKAEVGIPSPKSNGTATFLMTIFFGLIGIVLGVVIASWYTTQKLEQRGLEFNGIGKR